MHAQFADICELPSNATGGIVGNPCAIGATVR